MRSYTNREGEIVQVTGEHLDKAVQIKRELQMSSPSHRCSWAKHKKMMQKEGFDDSENSENYRLLIKNYQSSIGALESKEKHVDIVSAKKLEAIKEATGEMYYTKREVQLESRNLQKLKRELTLYGVVAEQVYEALVNELNMKIPHFFYEEKVPSIGNKMIVLLSDWHIGAVVVDVMGNNYNYDIATNRVKKFVEEIVNIGSINGVTDIEIVSLGDMTEHISMRNVNQSFEAEFPVAIQMTKAFELVRDMILNIIDNRFNVTYRGISGNHDRINGNKNDNIDGDSTTFIINYMIKLFSETVNLPRFKYVEADNINYSTTLDVNGVKMKFVHGDNESRNRILASHSALDGVSYNLIAMGHLHHYNVTEVGLNQFEAYFGSLMGINNYAKKGKFGTTASQGLVIVDENGEIDIRRVSLQDV